MAKARHIYPGNNTPQGFFSYYKYILSQREANRIMCIKGGPGVGKSSFMKAVADEFFENGESVDFMHCSSDPESLDGIVLRDRKIAFIDATSPHVVDPINPGAVDSILHLGEYWDEDGIRKSRMKVIETNEIIRKWFGRAYNYLGAAEKIYDNITALYDDAVESAEIYKIAAEIVGREFAGREITLSPGSIKKYFASAITPSGYTNEILSIIGELEKVYLISVPFGMSAERILNIVSEGAVYRGFNVEEYYCPLKPETKIEHLIIPELSVGFVTANEYHDVEPWQISAMSDGTYADIVMIDMNDLVNMIHIRKHMSLLEESRHYTSELMNKAISCIQNAKKEHDVLEGYYIPNMDFKKIDILKDEIIAKIKAEDV